VRAKPGSDGLSSDVYDRESNPTMRGSGLWMHKDGVQYGRQFCPARSKKWRTSFIRLRQQIASCVASVNPE
jgi:hypothetical protein